MRAIGPVLKRVFVREGEPAKVGTIRGAVLTGLINPHQSLRLLN